MPNGARPTRFFLTDIDAVTKFFMCPIAAWAIMHKREPMFHNFFNEHILHILHIDVKWKNIRIK